MNERRAFSVSIFCRHQGEILLIKHNRLGAWLPVGGEIEAGETPLEAAVRELEEETGLSGTFPEGLGVTGTPPGLIGYEEHRAGSKGLHMNFVFVADVPSRGVRSCDEFSDARWVSDTTALAPCPDNVRDLVRLALAAPGNDTASFASL
jgi:8-oxo-dGTP diphosphatase